MPRADIKSNSASRKQDQKEIHTKKQMQYNCLGLNRQPKINKGKHILQSIGQTQKEKEASWGTRHPFKSFWSFNDRTSFCLHLQTLLPLKVSPTLIKLPIPLFLFFLTSLGGLTQHAQAHPKHLHGKSPPSLWHHLLDQEDGWKINQPKGFDSLE